MVNEAWSPEGYTAFAQFRLPGFYSDHGPCVVTLLAEVLHTAKTFKFLNLWTQHEDFMCTVEQTWDRYQEGNCMFRLCKKLQALKRPLKELNKKHFGHIAARAEAAEIELLNAQQQLHDNPDNYQLQEHMANLRKNAARLPEADRSYCAQLAKVKYLKNSDRGTKFFHDLIKRNRERNQVVALTLDNGNTTTSQQQVKDTFVEFYQKLLGEKESTIQMEKTVIEEGRKINDEQASKLIQPITIDEIKGALFSIGEDKAPGPDGYT